MTLPWSTVQQVLAGKVNKDLVAKLRGRGVGLCGMDGQMLRCTELDPALGHVGEIIHVDPTLISTLLDGGYIPVNATVGMDDLGQAYNVNADTAAAQIAIALKAEKLVSMTDIAGLLRIRTMNPPSSPRWRSARSRATRLPALSRAA